MEPVNKRALDREVVPTHEPAEVKAEAPAEEKPVEESSEEKKPFGRRRRRAASSGVLTPGE
jgi:hypothetical protein